MKLLRIFSRMSILLLSGLTVLVGSCWLTTPIGAEQKQVQLPAGKGREIVAQKCVTCHELAEVTKQPHSKSEWQNLLRIMHIQGLKLTPEEDGTVLQYLTENLGKLDAEGRSQTREPSSPGAKKVTFCRDVAPILYEHCVVCHHPNDIAPMSLISYKEVRPWAAAIREKVVQRLMPPWHADPNVGEFSNDPRLTEQEIDTLRNWVSSGMKEGDPQDLPPTPSFQEGWHIKPDVVFSIPDFDVSAAGQDDYQYFHVPTNFKEDKWVQAVEVLPGDKRIVHHAGVTLETAEQAAKSLKTSNGGEYKGDEYFYYTGTLGHIRPEVPIVDDGCSRADGGTLQNTSDLETKHSGAIGIYLPGHLYESHPTGYALKIPAGSYLKFDVHYSNSRRLQGIRDRTSVGLVFAKEPPRFEAAELEAYNYLFHIPPNDPNHRATVCYTLSKDVMALAYTAHMHYRGKSMVTEAIYPDGRHEVLMNVPHYDFRWQETYYLKQPKLLPKGTKLMSTAYFDNSANNPQNPDPTSLIRYGDPSTEEMLSFWLQFSYPRPINEAAAVK
jgi:mono/diheme cytochrome c family protein